MRPTARFIATSLAAFSALSLAGCAPCPPPDPFRAGIEALCRERYAAAARDLEQTAKDQPDNPAVICHLGIAYWKQGKFEPAADAFKRAAALAPNDSQPLEYLGHAYMKMGRWAEAREALSTAYARSPRSPRLVTAAAIAQLHTEGPESAKSYLLYALNLDPLYPPALYDMALVNNDWLKDDAEAEKYFKKYLEVAGRDIPAADARRALKALQADRARRTVAVPAADAARAASRAPPVNPPAVEEAMKRTRAAIQREDFDEALMRLKETVSHYDRNADALWELALLYDRNLDDPAHAVETYQAFLGAFPNDPRARDARLRLARLAPVPPGGRQAPDVTPRASAAPASDIPPMSQLRFRKPARPDPRVAVEAYNMGNRYQKAGDWNRAIFYYTRAIENDDMFLNAYLNLGYTYRSSGDPQRARDAFAGALRIQPDLAKARYALALACRDLRQNADAIRHLSAALNADPGYADAHLLLGQMYQQTGGNTDRVRMHYLKYVELCPTGAVAPQVTKWLEYHEGR